MKLLSSGFRNKSVKLKTAKRRKASSSSWLRRQINDPFVAKAQLDGYRSRAAYKILEINEKFKILKPNIKVVDLGAAPGSWSQVAAQILKPLDNTDSKIVALDLLDIEELPGVIFIKKNFYDSDTAQTLESLLEGTADVVLSDMAANTTGHSATDHLRIIDLCENTIAFALTIIKPGGHFVAKIFRGGLENNLLDRVKRNFKYVKHFKPLSSRKESTEFYLVALDRKS